MNPNQLEHRVRELSNENKILWRLNYKLKQSVDKLVSANGVQVRSGELGKICGGVLGRGELEVDDESPASFLIAQRLKLLECATELIAGTNVKSNKYFFGREQFSPFRKQKGRNHETWVSLRQQITKRPEKHDGCEVEMYVGEKATDDGNRMDPDTTLFRCNRMQCQIKC